MNTSQGVLSFRRPRYALEWKLLIFLILFMDVKLAVKAFAIVLTFFFQPDFKFGFSLRNSRLPLFYPIVILIAVLNFIIYDNFSVNYLVVTGTGILIWVVCILAIHQVKLYVERTDIEILHNTLAAFFILNIALSLINMGVILIEIGFRNPFLYQGQYQKYFINTGDFIKGITFDTSTTNALINSFGIVYFLSRKKYIPVLACTVTLLVTASNFSNIVLFLVLAGIFLFKSIKEQKSIIAICIILLIAFLGIVSPQNGDYMSEMANKFIVRKKENTVTLPKRPPIRDTPDSLLSSEERKAKIAILTLDSLARERIRLSGMTIDKAKTIAVKRPDIPKENIHSPLFQWQRDTTIFQRQLYAYILTRAPNTVFHYSEDRPGKLQAFIQSYHYLKDNPGKIITGDGIGNFSSKLAFRATGLKMAGGFPALFTYCSPEFLKNHLNLYAYYFLKNAHSHSILHTPASVYDQMLTEYGFLGFFAFPVYYIGFFLRHLKKLSYGVPLLIILLSFFLVDYWFEQLSVVLLFELLMFMNIKQNSKSVEHA